MVEIKKRKLLAKLFAEKDRQKIAIILGPRQVGKTTLLKELHKKLGGLFLDLDVLENFEKVGSFERLINTLKLNGYEEKQKGTFYLFLDEFQHYDVMTKIMKNVFDNCKNVKIYASGSSSLKIKEQVQESLAGRKSIYYLYPLDFEEFLWFKEEEEALKQYKNAGKLEGEDLNLGVLEGLLCEYLVWGGYPEVVLGRGADEKQDVLKSIFDLYVKKELVNYLKLEDVVGAKRLVEFLAVNNGKKIKYEEAASACALKQYAVRAYMGVLGETFLIKTIRPFFTNKNKELVKMPKAYFLDNGVRNFFINNFNEVDIREDAGRLFESFVMQELIKGGVEELKFWEDKQKREVDFVIDLVSRQTAIEVKFKERLKAEDFLGLNAFLDEYDTDEAYLVNLGAQKKGKIELRLPFGIGEMKF
ncbi:hypothetical protein AUJ17_03690 [Candidatus Micrarchaeota archaeon CG1_02_47_40]|nr:MAG: hypothetical protein AUJ17_03690 [Candidatus Micrarchaeota archaeon CG1_02_47_40]